VTPPRAPRWASSGLLIGALLAASGCGWLNRSLIYQPAAELAGTPRQVGLDYEDIWLQAAGGAAVHAWNVPLASTSPVVLLCHGNGGNISHRVAKLQLLRRAGASVFLFDYRGFGHSTGKPTEEGTYEDGEAAYRWLLARGVPESRLVVYGESLGNGVAIELALRHNPGGLIVDSAFTSTVEIGKRIFPHLPVRWLVKYKYENLAKISRVRCPTLFLHSPDDEIIPYEMGRRLFAAAPRPKAFADLSGGHNDGFLRAARAYLEATQRFLSAVGA
jgi:uncharacterized protein